VLGVDLFKSVSPFASRLRGAVQALRLRPGWRPASREASAVLAFGGNLETRASAQTSKFLVPKSCALRARRPDWGATPRPALHRE
jgi:hypothetical protein